MYQVGDQVLYGIHGVCRITDQENRVLDGKKVTYLVLEPVGQDGSRYLVPTHNETAMAKLSRVLTSNELESLMVSEEIRGDAWIRDENQRKNRYRELITSGDRSGLLQMIRILYDYRKSQLGSGKRMHLADENFMKDAEKLLSSEISVILDIPQDEAKRWLRTRLKYE